MKILNKKLKGRDKELLVKVGASQQDDLTIEVKSNILCTLNGVEFNYALKEESIEGFEFIKKYTLTVGQDSGSTITKTYECPTTFWNKWILAKELLSCIKMGVLGASKRDGKLKAKIAEEMARFKAEKNTRVTKFNKEGVYDGVPRKIKRSNVAQLGK